MAETTVLPCSCGAVEVIARGSPMVTTTCYCDTCQDGSRRIEALPGAPAVRDGDGGTSYSLYRKDRVTCGRGSELLVDIKLDDGSKTSRVVASCCNTAMFMRFDDVRHWIPVYRSRFGPGAPAIQMRICTKYAPESTATPTGVPSYPDYPAALAMKLLSSRIAMLFRP